MKTPQIFPLFFLLVHSLTAPAATITALPEKTDDLNSSTPNLTIAHSKEEDIPPDLEKKAASFDIAKIVTQTRHQLIDSLGRGTQAVENLLNQLPLLGIDTSSTVFLLPGEELRLEILIAKPRKSLDTAWLSTPHPAVAGKVYPQADHLLKSLDSLLRVRGMNLIGKTPQLQSDERDFLSLLIKFLTGKHADRSFWDKLGKQATGFLEQYPQSRFLPFVKKRMKPSYRLGNRSFDAAFFIGVAQSSGLLEKLYSPRTEVGVQLGLHWKALVFIPSVQVGVGSTTREFFIAKNEPWPDSIGTQWTRVSLALGWTFPMGGRLLFTPFGGIAFVDISPEETLRRQGFASSTGMTPGWTAGLAADWCFRLCRDKKNPLKNGGGFLRLRAGVADARFEESYDSKFQGKTLFLQLGLGFKIWAIRR